MDNFDKLVDLFIKSDQLGHYDKDKHSITLYDIRTSSDSIYQLHKDIKTVTSKYKLALDKVFTDYTNVHILDIDL